MKIKFLIAFIFSAFISLAQENQTWRMGIQFGMAGNKSHFSGGMSDADARFVHGAFGAASLNWIVRYDYNERWKIESGLGFSSIGFEFSMLENYNFLQMRKKNGFSKSSVGTVEIPVIVSYKFKPNCRNAKWFVGAGFANVFVAKDVKYEQPKNNADLPGGITAMKNSTTVNQGLYFHPRLTVGKERILKHGGLISAALFWNFGLGEIAKSSIDYQIDSNEYHHEFTNNGHFMGCRVAYFFRTKKSGK